jgi:hypothetical protein
MKTQGILLGLLLPCCASLAADVTGTWKSEFDSQIGLQKYTYTFKQDGTNLTGKANSEISDQKREAELKEGRVDGDKVSFVEMLNFQGNDIRITYSGILVSNEMKLTREVGTFAKENIVVKRDGASAANAGQPGPRRRGFGGPIELGPDDKPAFPPVPEGYDKARDGNRPRQAGDGRVRFQIGRQQAQGAGLYAARLFGGQEVSRALSPARHRRRRGGVASRRAAQRHSRQPHRRQEGSRR